MLAAIREKKIEFRMTMKKIPMQKQFPDVLSAFPVPRFSCPEYPVFA
jgi:hypothetical protein